MTARTDRPAKYNRDDLHRALAERDCTVQQFTGAGGHMRVWGNGFCLDVWPEAASWKHRRNYRRASLFEFIQYVDSLLARVKAPA